MAYNTADTTYSIVAETTAGTIPATPAFLRMPYIGGTAPSYDHDTLQSNVRTFGRGEADQRMLNFRVGGGNKLHFRRDPSIDLLLQSLLSGTWTSNVLVAGKTETNFTIEECFNNGTTPLYNYYSGLQVSSFSMDGDAAGNLEATFNYMGLTRTQPGTTPTGATYAAYATTTPLTGMDVAVSIAGITAPKGTKFSLKVDNTRETLTQFGSPTPFGIGTSDRKVSGSITLFRENFSPESTLFTNNIANKVAVTFTFASLTNGYTITIPAAQFSLPQNSEDNSKVLYTMDFIGTVDPVNSDIKISKP